MLTFPLWFPGQTLSDTAPLQGCRIDYIIQFFYFALWSNLQKKTFGLKTSLWESECGIPDGRVRSIYEPEETGGGGEDVDNLHYSFRRRRERSERELFLSELAFPGVLVTHNCCCCGSWRKTRCCCNVACLAHIAAREGKWKTHSATELAKVKSLCLWSDLHELGKRWDSGQFGKCAHATEEISDTKLRVSRVMSWVTLVSLVKRSDCEKTVQSGLFLNNNQNK